MKPIYDVTVADAEADLRDAEALLLAAVPDGQRPEVRTLLTNPRCGGRGLRAWLGMLAADRRPLPDALPGELVAVYLADADAEPLHDCEKCGLPVPVRAARRAGHEPTCDRVYFAACPHCGGRTGPHAFWSRAVN